jgi:uncharacterized protein (DUF885 family)
VKRLLLCSLLLACAKPVAPVAAPAPAPGMASDGVADARLADLLERHWDFAMRDSPIRATLLGDHRFDDQLFDRSPAAFVARRAAVRGFLAEARAIDGTSLSPADRLSLALFVEMIGSEAAVDEACLAEEWSISVFDNPLFFNQLPELHRPTDLASARLLLWRYRKIPAAIRQDVANLRRGLARKAVGNAATIHKVLAMVDGQLGKPDGEWPLRQLFKRPAASPAEAAELDAQLNAALAEVRVALVAYRAFVADELLPAARSDGNAGLAALPFGAACYAAQIHENTSLPTATADELHALGLAEISRINAEMIDLGEKLFGSRELPVILARLREDPAVHFATAEEIEAKAAASLAAAKARMPAFFGIIPKADCVIRRIPDYEAPFSTTAYYREPQPGGSKPGEYFVNVFEPATRPRFEAEALAFHESIPGHHLQIAIAQELPAVPAFRKYSVATAYIEGWGLYAERLAADMGLYSGDLDRMGMLSYDAWRASRLVVDTGLHEKGWSRQQAEAFMLAHTALSAPNVTNEVDRYINTPGQALAYKVGQLTLLRLRSEAQTKLGAKFDLKAFHDVVLGSGPVTLPVLEDLVKAWAAKG